MRRWDYEGEPVRKCDLLELAKSRGERGWELCAYLETGTVNGTGGQAIFKRRSPKRRLKRAVDTKRPEVRGALNLAEQHYRLADASVQAALHPKNVACRPRLRRNHIRKLRAQLARAIRFGGLRPPGEEYPHTA